MNFLAHFYLSDHHDQLLAGNFVADFVRGKKYRLYPETIGQGIIMHRKIDTFTDSHPLTRQSISRVRPRFGKLAGVVVDMFYDYLLASDWQNYHRQPLQQFADNTCQRLQQQARHFPEQAVYVLGHMQRYNWLANYARIEGIRASLNGISHRFLARTGANIELGSATDLLVAEEQAFRQEFSLFFEQIRAAAPSFTS